MPYIRAHETTERRKGKVLTTYAVVWREPERDKFGIQTGKMMARQETHPTREAAETRRDELNAAKHTNTTSALVKAKAAGEKPFGHYARLWLDAQQIRVSDGRLSPGPRG